MPSGGSTLDALRQEIDQIDEQLHALVRRRVEVVREIGRAKAGSPGFRPAREAIVLRRLAQRHSGDLPLASLIRLWRELIGAALVLQGRFSVAALCVEEDTSLIDMARDHYGILAPVQGHSTPAAVIRSVSEGSAAVGVLPMPYEGDPQPWWRLIAADDPTSPRICFRLPFAGRGNRRGRELDALIVSLAPVEPSGADRSLFAARIPIDVSRASLKRHLTAARLKGDIIALDEAPGDGDGRMCLIEVPEFLASGDPRLTQLANAVERVIPLGAYPVPLSAPRKGGQQ